MEASEALTLRAVDNAKKSLGKVSGARSEGEYGYVLNVSGPGIYN